MVKKKSSSKKVVSKKIVPKKIISKKSVLKKVVSKKPEVKVCCKCDIHKCMRNSFITMIILLVINAINNLFGVNRVFSLIIGVIFLGTMITTFVYSIKDFRVKKNSLAITALIISGLLLLIQVIVFIIISLNKYELLL